MPVEHDADLEVRQGSEPVRLRARASALRRRRYAAGAKNPTAGNFLDRHTAADRKTIGVAVDLAVGAGASQRDRVTVLAVWVGLELDALRVGRLRRHLE